MMKSIKILAVILLVVIILIFFIIRKPEPDLWKVTAYCECEICCGEYADGITASGYRVGYGGLFCAAKLPFCTVLDIPGYGLTVVLDRGGAIGEKCVDVYFPTHEEALAWGVQYLEIRRITGGPS